jgi:DNA-binding CsgD family transcriptional regulator
MTLDVREAAATDRQRGWADIDVRSALVERIVRLVVAAPKERRTVRATINGDAGHGKSTLLHQVTERLERSGRVVVAMEGGTIERGIPYAGLHGMVQHHGRSDSTDRLLEVMADQRNGIAPLAVSRALVSWFDALGGDRPVVATVDDADLLDEASLRVLLYVTSRQPPGQTSVVVTATRVVRLLDPSLTIVVHLDDLDRSAALRLASSAGAPDLAVHQMVDRLGGNPLAIVHAAPEMGPRVEKHMPLPVAPRLAADVGDRTDDLPAEAVRLLETAAITGERSIEVLDAWNRAAAHQPFDDLIAAAEDAGLIDGDGSDITWHRPWMAEAIAARCPAGRRERVREGWRRRRRAGDPLRERPTGALSPAERRVVEVIVQGASTRDAADELALSHKTVESHLQSAYRKLGVRSRSQLSALLLNPHTR